MSKVDHVLFDLDGTLIDTAPDLAAALNQILIKRDYSPLPLEGIRPFVSLGAIAMISAAFKITKDHENFDNIREQFLNAYSENIAEKSRLFSGMETVLEELDKNNVPWGIVTNKPNWLTQPLTELLGLNLKTNCIVSGDTTQHAKPHPAPMFYACELLNCKPEQVVYVGDAKRDIEAGRNAGMHTLAASYGYIAIGDDPKEWEADGIVDTPHEILNWLFEFNT